jgi:predicted acyltransferase
VLDFLWLLTGVVIVYFGWDAHQRLKIAKKETTVPKSLIMVGIIFLMLAAYHIYSDMSGAPISLAYHLSILIVLAYAVYEYRKLIRQAHSER